MSAAELAPTSFEVPSGPPATPKAPEAPAAPSDSEAWPFEATETAGPPAASDAVESLEDLAPVDADGEFAPVAGFESKESAEPDPQATLRSYFLKEGAIDAQKIVSHCAELPGIEAAALLGKDGATSAESGKFQCDPADAFKSLSELTQTLGGGSDAPLTARCGNALFTFFSGDDLAIAVKHDTRGFRPGVRERLTLISQELGTLAG